MAWRMIDRSPQFISRMELKSDQVLGRMAAEIEVVAKSHVPVKKGQLLSSGSTRRMGFLKWRVEFNKEYAAYQERGARADGSHVVRHYTTPGTGKDYLKNAGKQIAGKFAGYYKGSVGSGGGGSGTTGGVGLGLGMPGIGGFNVNYSTAFHMLGL